MSSDPAPSGPQWEPFRLDRHYIWRQVKLNVVAIVSVIVALSGLGYNTYRNERTEHNRNTRIAAFEALKTLGEAQVIVEYAHFKKLCELGAKADLSNDIWLHRALSRLGADTVIRLSKLQ